MKGLHHQVAKKRGFKGKCSFNFNICLQLITLFPVPAFLKNVNHHMHRVLYVNIHGTLYRNKSEINCLLESEILMRKSGFASGLYPVLLEDTLSTYKTFPKKTFPPQNVSFTQSFLQEYSLQNVTSTTCFLPQNVS